jgi:hypothetical protein
MDFSSFAYKSKETEPDPVSSGKLTRNDHGNADYEAFYKLKHNFRILDSSLSYTYTHYKRIAHCLKNLATPDTRHLHDCSQFFQLA